MKSFEEVEKELKELTARVKVLEQKLSHQEFSKTVPPRRHARQ